MVKSALICFSIVGVLLSVFGSSCELAGQTKAPPPATPADYYRALIQARDLSTQRQFDKAADLYERLVSYYADDAQTWERLGDCRLNLKQYAPAAKAYERAHELGVWEPAASAYRIARSHALAGDKTTALAWLKRSVELGYERRAEISSDPAFTKLRDDPSFATIADPAPRPELTRVEGWRGDLAFLISEIKRLHYLYRSRPLPHDFEQAANALNENIPKLTDEEIFVSMQGLMARLGDGHSVLYLFGGPRSLKALPIRWYLFSDGLYIIHAADNLKGLIGSRVEKIGDSDPKDVFRRMDPYVSKESPMFTYAIGAYFLLTPEFLRVIGAIPNAKQVSLTIKDRAGHRSQVLLQPESGTQFTKYLTPSEVPGAPSPPMYMKRETESYWFERLPGTSTVYFQFNQVVDRPDESLTDFSLRLRRSLDEQQIQNLIVDVRHNSGGNAELLTSLWRTLIHFETTRSNPRLFVITSRTTFSATQIFISKVERLTNAVFVGEPSSSSPNFVGEDTTLTLPYSGVIGSISSRYHQTDGMDHRLWIAPKIPVALSSRDYFANRDPSLEAILEIIRN